MSDNEKNSKLSEFDFDGDNASGSNEKVIDPTMMESKQQPQNMNTILGVCALLVLGYYFSGSIFSSSEPEVPALSSSQSSMQIESPMAMTSSEGTMNMPVNSSDSVSDEMTQTLMPAMKKNIASEDDENWKKLEKEILAQNQSQTEVKSEITTLISKNDQLIQVIENSLQKNLKETLKETESIERELKGLQQNVISLKQALGSFDGQFSKIEKKIEAIEKQLVAQAAEFFAETDLAEVVQEPENHYSIYAVIPGRAWLRSHDNSIMSIVEGQQVKGLGKVMTIDARLTSVTFENGTILRH